MKALTISTKDLGNKTEHFTDIESAENFLRSATTDVNIADCEYARKYLIQHCHPDKEQSCQNISIDDVNYLYKKAIATGLFDSQCDLYLTQEEALTGQDVRVTVRSAVGSYVAHTFIKPGTFKNKSLSVYFATLNIYIKLYIHVLQCNNSSNIKLRGKYDIEQHIKIPLSVALLGGVIEVVGLSEKTYEISIDGGVQPGDTIVVKGAGILHSNDSTNKNNEVFGDMYVIINVTIPKLTDKNTRVHEL